MTNVPPPMPGSYPARPRRSNTVTIVWVVAICVLGMVGLIGGIFGILGSSQVTKTSVQRAQTDPRVIEHLGEPIKQGWIVQGSVETSGPSGNADVSIPLSGSKRKGTLYAVARKRDGIWTFQALELEVEGEPGRIDLLSPATLRK